MPKEQVTTGEEKRGSWGWVIAVVVLVLLLLGLGGYLWWRSNSDRTQQARLQNQINALTNMATSNSVNSSSNNSVSNSTAFTNQTNATNGNSDGSSSATTTKVKLYLVAIDDGGVSGKMIGCNDSVVAVDKEIAATNAPLRAAYEQLLALDSRDYGKSGLVNALYNSNLTIDEVSIQNKVATIKLKGTLSSAGTCDDPRIIAQLTETALQFTTISSVQVFVNGKKIEDLLSGK